MIRHYGPVLLLPLVVVLSIFSGSLDPMPSVTGRLLTSVAFLVLGALGGYLAGGLAARWIDRQSR